MKDITFQVIIVGVGGTGGYCASFISQLAATRPDAIKSITLCDYDEIEEKNICRQPFFSHEIGRKKASVLASKINTVYEEVSCYSYPHYIENVQQLKDLLDDSCIPLIVGAVDNAFARVVMDEFFYDPSIKDVFYVDSGNEEWYGNVTLGYKVKNQVISPPISGYFPNILDTSKSVPKSMEHCSEKVFSGKQQAVTNQMAAVITSGIVGQLVNGELVNEVVFFDSKDFSVGKINVTANVA